MSQIIKREIVAELKQYLDKKEILLITGPRQAGKTTVMNILADYLKKQNQKTLFLSLDFEKDRPHFISQEKLINKIKMEIGSQAGYVFIDEIQRKENAGLFLKGIYDQNLPYKFIVSGSGSLELKEKIHESLAGRKLIFYLPTLSFKEFVNFKTNYQYENKLTDFFQIEKEASENLLNEYLNFGGYPRVVISQTNKERTRIINEIYTSYLERDVSYWLAVAKTENFSALLQILAPQIGQIVNYAELANTLNLSMPTVKIYLNYLEKTFIVSRLTPFFTNKRKEIAKSPVYYFNDLGLRNYLVDLFGDLTTQNIGYVFENFVFNILANKLRYTNSSIHFWRTKGQAEVDFVVRTGQKIIPYEVKYKKLFRPTLPRSLVNFLKAYSPPDAFVVNLNLKQTVSFHQTKVHFIPFWGLLT